MLAQTSFDCDIMCTAYLPMHCQIFAHAHKHVYLSRFCVLIVAEGSDATQSNDKPVKKKKTKKSKKKRIPLVLSTIQDPLKYYSGRTNAPPSHYDKRDVESDLTRPSTHPPSQRAPVPAEPTLFAASIASEAPPPSSHTPLDGAGNQNDQPRNSLEVGARPQPQSRPKAHLPMNAREHELRLNLHSHSRPHHLSTNARAAQRTAFGTPSPAASASDTFDFIVSSKTPGNTDAPVPAAVRKPKFPFERIKPDPIGAAPARTFAPEPAPTGTRIHGRGSKEMAYLPRGTAVGGHKAVGRNRTKAAPLTGLAPFSNRSSVSTAKPVRQFEPGLPLRNTAFETDPSPAFEPKVEPPVAPTNEDIPTSETPFQSFFASGFGGGSAGQFGGLFAPSARQSDSLWGSATPNEEDDSQRYDKGAANRYDAGYNDGGDSLHYNDEEHSRHYNNEENSLPYGDDSSVTYFEGKNGRHVNANGDIGAIGSAVRPTTTQYMGATEHSGSLTRRHAPFGLQTGAAIEPPRPRHTPFSDLRSGGTGFGSNTLFSNSDAHTDRFDRFQSMGGASVQSGPLTSPSQTNPWGDSSSDAMWGSDPLPGVGHHLSASAHLSRNGTPAAEPYPVTAFGRDRSRGRAPMPPSARGGRVVGSGVPERQSLSPRFSAGAAAFVVGGGNGSANFAGADGSGGGRSNFVGGGGKPKQSPW